METRATYETGSVGRHRSDAVRRAAAGAGQAAYSYRCAWRDVRRRAAGPAARCIAHRSRQQRPVRHQRSEGWSRVAVIRATAEHDWSRWRAYAHRVWSERRGLLGDSVNWESSGLRPEAADDRNVSE